MARALTLGILSFALDSFSVRRLRQAITARNHQSKLLDANQTSLICTQNQLSVRLSNKSVPALDVVIPRLGAGSPSEGIDMVRHFELSKTPVTNSAQAICRAREKFLTLQMLTAANVPVPPSCCVTHAAGARAAIEQLGGAPVILKLNRGTQGIGVMLAESAKSAEAIFETMQLTHTPVVIQKYIGECRGRDVRAFVVNGQVVAAMRRLAQGDEFRSNYHRGGRVEACTLDEHTKEIAVRAAHTLGLHIAGVDILESSQGPLVMELNSSPGLEGIESATNIDVAGKVIEFALLKAKEA